MLQEEQLRTLSARLKHFMPKEDMSFVLLQWIPCILRMENQIGIKKLTLLLAKGLSCEKAGSQPLYQQSSKAKRERAFAGKLKISPTAKFLDQDSISGNSRCLLRPVKLW